MDFEYEYEIVTGNTTALVKEQVEALYKQGWIAKGGVSLSVHFAFGIVEREFAQAMLRVRV